jgi:hypothetical protein
MDFQAQIAVLSAERAVEESSGDFDFNLEEKSGITEPITLFFRGAEENRLVVELVFQTSTDKLMKCLFRVSNQLKDLENHFSAVKDEGIEVSGLKRNNRGNLVQTDPHRRRLKNHVPLNIPFARFLINPPGGYVYMPNSDPRFSLPRDLTKAASSGNLDKYRQLHIDHLSEDCVFMSQCDGNFNPYGPLQREIYGKIISIFKFMCLFLILTF